MKEKLKHLLNPFEKIAGAQALLWGVLGLAVSTVLSYYAQVHYHGLMSYGPAKDNSLWIFAAEHLIVWLIPALIFLIGGMIFSKSRIRPIDVLGTVAFAQLPLIINNLINFLPPMQALMNFDPGDTPIEMLIQPGVLTGIWIAVVSMIFLIWTLVWMFQALRVSCNLKGAYLVTVYCIGVLGGDILCRVIIFNWLR